MTSCCSGKLAKGVILRIVRGADAKSIAATRVIFLTADAQRDTVMSAKDLSVDGYLVKPVSLHRLQSNPLKRALSM